MYVRLLALHHSGATPMAEGSLERDLSLPVGEKGQVHGGDAALAQEAQSVRGRRVLPTFGKESLCKLHRGPFVINAVVAGTPDGPESDSVVSIFVQARRICVSCIVPKCLPDPDEVEQNNTGKHMHFVRASNMRLYGEQYGITRLSGAIASPSRLTHRPWCELLRYLSSETFR